MIEDLDTMEVHPSGERKTKLDQQFPDGILDTFGGKIRVEWDPSAKITAFGPVSYFIHFLKTSGLWDQWVELCPLQFTSNNAPSKEKILATILLSVLAGHKRYAHITAIRADKVLPDLLGVSNLASEDSVRRAFQNRDEAALSLWMDKSMNTVFEPLLTEPWILEVDGTMMIFTGKRSTASKRKRRLATTRPSQADHPMSITPMSSPSCV